VRAGERAPGAKRLNAARPPDPRKKAGMLAPGKVPLAVEAFDWGDLRGFIQIVAAGETAFPVHRPAGAEYNNS
jgi:hypothetical protein